MSAREEYISQTGISVKGKQVVGPQVEIAGRCVITRGTWLKMATLNDEELVEGELIDDPDAFVGTLKNTLLKADIFTFAEKLPETSPRYSYHVEWDNLAAIPITTMAEWWDKRVESSVRRAVRKAGKSGVDV